MHIWQTNIHTIYHINNSVFGTKPTSEEKDLGVITNNLMVSKHFAYAHSKANRILSMIRKTFKSWDSRLLYKMTVHPHLEYCSSAWSPLSTLPEGQESSGTGTTSLHKTNY